MRREAPWEKGSGIHDHSPLEVGERYVDPQQGQPALQIGDYLATLRLRRWLVLAIAAVFTIGGVLYSLTLEPSYVATSEVLLSAQTDPTSIIAQEVNPETEAQVATSPEVAILAKSKFETDMTPDGDDQEPHGESALRLNRCWTSNSPLRRPRRHKAAPMLSRTPISSSRPRQTQDGIQGQIDALDDRLAQLQIDLAAANKVLRTEPENSPEWLTAQTTIQTIQTQIGVVTHPAGRTRRASSPIRARSSVRPPRRSRRRPRRS